MKTVMERMTAKPVVTSNVGQENGSAAYAREPTKAVRAGGWAGERQREVGRKNQ
jgi:hypothetical protein